MHTMSERIEVQRLGLMGWALLAIAAVLLSIPFAAALTQMAGIWLARPEYSHGLLVPLVAALLLWQQKDVIEREPFSGSWAGVAVVLAGAALYVLGEIATLYTIVQYAFLVVFYGLVLSLVGWRIFRRLWMPLLVLVFMIPLPNFLLNNFSAQLQLISSQFGVWIIRLFGISVYLEGNIIDLGSYRLQVAEACDGLRYLFPLMTLGFIMAYFYKAAMWKRVLLFVSSIPITILMNSLRVGIIGVLVEYWGQSMAEGFLHDFQGWVVFMASAVIMLLEMVLLARIGPDRRPWREVFAFEFPAPTPPGARIARRPLQVPFLASLGVVAALALIAAVLPQRAEAVPARDRFLEFPMRIATWIGRQEPLEQIYVDTLRFDDYINAEFVRAADAPINLYVAYYASQRKGQSAHSPRSCIPGGGWRITGLRREDIPLADGSSLAANRVQIEFGPHKQIVYYWFQQRDRIITNEYLVKWYIFWDALTRNRTDGALVRLSAPLAPGAAPEQGDAQLKAFASEIASLLGRFIPS